MVQASAAQAAISAHEPIDSAADWDDVDVFLRIYLSDFQKNKLISGDEEVVLAQRMEQQHKLALDALAIWPQGIEAVLAAGLLVQAKKRTLFSMSMGPLEAQPELDDKGWLSSRAKQL